MNQAIAVTLPANSLVGVGVLLRKIREFRSFDVALFSRISLKTALPCIIFLSISNLEIETSELLILAFCGLSIALLMRFLAGGGTRRCLKLEGNAARVSNLPAGSGGEEIATKNEMIDYWFNF
jgi:predicted permease